LRDQPTTQYSSLRPKDFRLQSRPSARARSATSFGAINVASKDQWFVTKISSDPYMALSQARAVAADLDLPVNF